MTELGTYLFKRSINKAEVSRKSGLSRSRMSELTLNDRSHLRVGELWLIAKAIDTDVHDLLDYVCRDL